MGGGPVIVDSEERTELSAAEIEAINNALHNA